MECQVGQVIGSWTVIEHTKRGERNGGWICRCACGEKRVLRGRELTKNPRAGCSKCMQLYRHWTAVKKWNAPEPVPLDPNRVRIEDIQRVVAKYFGLTQRELLAPVRHRKLARPRQYAMALARELTTRSTTFIGHRFGGLDHSTVIHAADRIADLRRLFQEHEDHWVALRNELMARQEAAQ